MIHDTNATLTENEHIPDGIDVRGKGVIGCQKTGRDVMVTAILSSDPRKGGGTRFVDLFLTREQAVDLRARLDRVIAANPVGEES